MIKLEKVSKSYRDVLALCEFTYEFAHGVYAVLGPNGSGKSTLMNIMTGNLRRDGGEITFSSRSGEAGGLPDTRIGYVPQYPGMYPDFTLYEMLDYTSALSPTEGSAEQIEELISALDLTEYRSKKIRALSGGTKQRLAIAQAFIGAPELVILDEPTSGLDPMQRIIFKNFIAKKRGEATIIISTHIVSDAENMADNIIFLKRGCIVRSGSPDEILSDLGDMCWSVPSDFIIPDGMLTRSEGSEVRVISDVKPTDRAVSVPPTLEDGYLYVFGERGVDEGDAK
ncbi:MAG: ABC transporter ATP-binding protein [Firmicutes bacterium]|nr:ABC transporter ATP-binding protein [Bacillota bacterium]